MPASLMEIKEALLMLMMTASGLLIMVGLRKWGIGLLIATIVFAVRGPLMVAFTNTFINELPPEFYPYRNLIFFGIIFAISMFFFLRTAIVREFMKAFFLHVSIDIFYAMLKMPFRILRWFFNLVFQRNNRIN